MSDDTKPTTTDLPASPEDAAKVKGGLGTGTDDPSLTPDSPNSTKTPPIVPQDNPQS